MKPSESPGRDSWAAASRRLTPALRPLAAPTVTSKSRATCCASPRIRVTAIAWSAYFTTRSSVPGRFKPDGTSFYYSDYASTGKKVWYRDKWPCCSGTFPQLAADYHISTYLRSADGVYVNLFTPSTVQWKDVSGQLRTEAGNQVSLRQQDSDPGVWLRSPRNTRSISAFPAWARPNPVLSVNGKRVSDAVDPGTFASIRRTWKDGDRVELELPMPLRLEPVDANHQNMVALMQGPLVLFAVGRFATDASIGMHCCKPSRPTTPPEIGWRVRPTAAA